MKINKIKYKESGKIKVKTKTPLAAAALTGGRVSSGRKSKNTGSPTCQKKSNTTNYMKESNGMLAVMRDEQVTLENKCLKK